MPGVEGGGSAIVAEWLAAQVVQEQFEVVFISTRRRKGIQVEEKNSQRRYLFRPWNLYWVGDKDSRPLPLRMLWQTFDIWNPHAYRVVRRILRYEKPDVVHIHKLRGLSPSIFRAAQDAGCTCIVHTLHDHELISPEGTLYGKIGDWVQDEIPLIRFYQALRRRATQSVHHVSAPSQYLLAATTSRGFFDNVSQSVIPNSHGFSNVVLADLRRQAKTKAPLHSSPLRLLYLGRLDNKKGILFFCQAFLEAYKLSTNIHLDIVGTGAAESEVRQIVLGHPAVTMHGALYSKEKTVLISECNALVVPSIGVENAPLSVVEAYAYGKPVIVSDIGGISEMVIPDQTGFLIPPNNIQAWVESIVSLSNKPNILGSMSERCFDQATQYTPESVLDAYRRIYHHRFRPGKTDTT